MNENKRLINLNLKDEGIAYLKRNNQTESLRNEDCIILEGKEYVIEGEIYGKVEVYGTEERITGFYAINKKDFFKAHPFLKIQPGKKDLTEFTVRDN